MCVYLLDLIIFKFLWKLVNYKLKVCREKRLLKKFTRNRVVQILEHNGIK